MITATYSPDDNKLRLYASARLDPETYKRVHDAGFRWAPKQELFVAPSWSPAAEDVCLALAGEVGDEDTSLLERAETRAERFEGYAENRAADGDAAQAAAERLAGGPVLGSPGEILKSVDHGVTVSQSVVGVWTRGPILVGHHSEKRARKDAEKIRSGFERAAKAFETSDYWTRRAAGAVAAAKYKERPDVRARRIKGLEADERKMQKQKAHAETLLRLWTKLHEPGSLHKNGAEVTFRERALAVCNLLDRTDYGTWSNLADEKVTPEEVQAKRLAELPRYIATADRWLAHLAGRLSYERAMLAESGYVEPPKPKTSAALPLLNYSGPVAYRNPYQRGEIIRGEAVPLTKAEWAAINDDYKGTRVSECGTHRLRTALLGRGTTRGLCVVYLSDSKAHPRPTTEAVQAKAQEGGDAREAAIAEKLRQAQERPAGPASTPDRAAAAREALRSGVTVAVAPQLFPTPVPLAARMAKLGDLGPGHSILEPSAGTGRLIDAAALDAWDWGGDCVAVESSPALADGLRAKYRSGFVLVECADFLTLTLEHLGIFDRVLMNPPFADGADVRHILHARTFLRPGGRLVALCAAGPRQEAALRPLASSWEVIEDAFREQGTGVRVALLTMDAEVTR